MTAQTLHKPCTSLHKRRPKSGARGAPATQGAGRYRATDRSLCNLCNLFKRGLHLHKGPAGVASDAMRVARGTSGRVGVDPGSKKALVCRSTARANPDGRTSGGRLPRRTARCTCGLVTFASVTLGATPDGTRCCRTSDRCARRPRCRSTRSPGQTACPQVVHASAESPPLQHAVSRSTLASDLGPLRPSDAQTTEVWPAPADRSAPTGCARRRCNSDSPCNDYSRNVLLPREMTHDAYDVTSVSLHVHAPMASTSSHVTRVTEDVRGSGFGLPGRSKNTRAPAPKPPRLNRDALRLAVRAGLGIQHRIRSGLIS